MPKQRRYYKRGGLNNVEKRQVKSLALKAVTPLMEKKHHDTSLVINITSSTFATDLTDMVQDNTDTSRNGDRVSLQSIYMSFEVAYSIPAAVRLVLVQWHDNSSDNSINTGDIFQFGATPATTNTIQSPLNIDQTKKFTILWDKIMQVNPNISAVSKAHQIRLFKNKRFQKKLQFNEAVTAGANKLYLLAFSDSATAGALNGYARVRYYDG